MESVAEGLWILAENFERNGNVLQALKCLEAICQSRCPFLPIVEVKTRLQLATLLLNHTDNLLHAKNHLERAQLLLKQIPSCFELKCRTYSLLSRCYHLVGNSSAQKQILKKGLELAAAGDGVAAYMWMCNFNLQLANALTIEGDVSSVTRVLESGLSYAAKTNFPQLQLVFAASMLHVQLMQCDDPDILQRCINLCDHLWNQIPVQGRESYLGLHVYSQLLSAFYFLRICDYKGASTRVEILDSSLAGRFERARLSLLPPDEKRALSLELETQESSLHQHLNSLNLQLQDRSTPDDSKRELYFEYQKTQQQLQILIDQKPLLRENSAELKLPLGPFPLDGEWLPTAAALVLVDIVAIFCARPKGVFKETSKRLESGFILVNGELARLGVTPSTRETHLQHWSVWMAGVYLMLRFQLLENKIVIDLTRTEFVEAQQSLVEVLDFFSRFPTIFQGCESSIHILLGHYAHSVGCFEDAALHFVEGGKMTPSKTQKAMCDVYAAISLICLGDADSSSYALDLIGPVYKSMDTFIGVREKTLVLFASGLLQMKQHNPQEARTRLANGLKITHKELGNHQLVSQYLTVLGSLAFAMHDTSQALSILKSSFLLAKTLHDIPAQIGVLSELTALYRELGETGKEIETFDYEQRRVEELARHIQTSVSSDHHLYLLKFRFKQDSII